MRGEEERITIITTQLYLNIIFLSVNVVSKYKDLSSNYVYDLIYIYIYIYINRCGLINNSKK